jgi:hypothetical protein
LLTQRQPNIKIQRSGAEVLGEFNGRLPAANLERSALLAQTAIDASTEQIGHYCSIFQKVSEKAAYAGQKAAQPR